MRLTGAELEIEFVDDQGNSLYAANNALVQYPHRNSKRASAG